MHGASEGAQDSSCSREQGTSAWHCLPEHLSHPAVSRGWLWGFFPVSGISSTHFGRSSLPCGAKELLTSRQVTVCWDEAGGDPGLRCVSLPYFPAIFHCCTITAESKPGFPCLQTQMCTTTVFSGCTTPETSHDPASTSSSIPGQQQRNEREDLSLGPQGICNG